MTQKRYNKIPKRQKCINKEEPYIGGAEDIVDDTLGKPQSQVNQERIEDIAAEVQRAQDAEGLLQSEINALNSQNYVTVDSFSSLPDTGAVDTVYRVSNWDGTQQDPTVYSEYSWNGSQYVHLSTKTQIGEVFDISAYHATGGELAKYADLAAALGTYGANIPDALRKGGMSVKFVCSSDNKYVQARCMAQNFTTDVTQWQGVDDVPTAGSENLVKSMGVEKFVKQNVNNFTNTLSVGITSWNTILSNLPITNGTVVRLDFLLSTTISRIIVNVNGVHTSTGSIYDQNNPLTKFTVNFTASVDINSIEVYIVTSSSVNVTLTCLTGFAIETQKVIDESVRVVSQSLNNTKKETARNNIGALAADYANKGYLYAGLATPSTDPGSVSNKIFYFCIEEGTYTNFENSQVNNGLNILSYNGQSWSVTNLDEYLCPKSTEDDVKELIRYVERLVVVEENQSFYLSDSEITWSNGFYNNDGSIINSESSSYKCCKIALRYNVVDKFTASNVTVFGTGKVKYILFNGDEIVSVVTSSSSEEIISLVINDIPVGVTHIGFNRRGTNASNVKVETKFLLSETDKYIKNEDSDIEIKEDYTKEYLTYSAFIDNARLTSSKSSGGTDSVNATAADYYSVSVFAVEGGTTYYVPVKGMNGDNANSFRYAALSAKLVATYDNDLNFIEKYGNSLTTSVALLAITPSTDGYLYVEYNNGESSPAFKNIYAGKHINLKKSAYNDVLYGKKWAVLGDSFTEGSNSGLLDEGIYMGKQKTYPYFIGNRTGINVLDTFFKAGRTLAYPASGDFTNSICAPNQAYNYQNIPSDVDYITIYLGINDSHHATGGGDGEDQTGYIPIGTITDNTVNSYYGAWNVVLSWLIENRSFAHIGIIISNGCDTADYRTAQIAIARKYGIPYIDLNGDDRTPFMIRSNNEDIPSAIRTIRTQQQAVDYAGGNLHPNDDAHEFESMFIENFLKSI